MSAELEARIARLEQQLANLVSRATVVRVTDSGKGQTLQVSALDGETLDVEHQQAYGFSSVPPAIALDGSGKGAEAVVVFVGGSRSHGIAISTVDRRTRPVDGESGEVTVYDDQGQLVKIGRLKIEITAKAGQTVELGQGGVLVTVLDGVVTGRGTDPLTGLTYAALGSASATVLAEG